MRKLLSQNSREKRAQRGKCARREKYMIIQYVHTSIVKQLIIGAQKLRKIIVKEQQRKMRTQRKKYDYRVCPFQYCQALVVQW